MVYSRSSSCESVMGSGLWGGELVHIVIHMSICPFKQFLINFIAYKLFQLRYNKITRLLSFLCMYWPFLKYSDRSACLYV